MPDPEDELLTPAVGWMLAGLPQMCRSLAAAVDFVLWGTTRAPWREHVSVTGDADYAAGVLDRINIGWVTDPEGNRVELWQTA